MIAFTPMQTGYTGSWSTASGFKAAVNPAGMPGELKLKMPEIEKLHAFT